MGNSLDRDQWEEHLYYKYCGSTGEFGGDSDFTLMCNAKRFSVTVSPSSDSNNKAGILVSRYNDAVEADDDDEIENIQQDIDDIIFDAGWQIFAQLAPSPKVKAPEFPKNLLLDLYPETYYFRLVMAGETAEIRQSPTLYEATPRFSLESKGDFSWPQYLATNIVVTQKLMGSGYIARMSINGQDMCCNIDTAMHGPAVQREFECLQKISTSQNTSSLRIPKLMGLVVDDDGKRLGS